MLLLFFAFLCGLIWWYTTYSFKDDTSKNSLIPGFKAAMLLFAFILVLTDVFMFVETNRLVAASANSFNGSCVTYDGSLVYYPSSQAVAGGSLVGGTVSSLYYVNDGNIDDIIESGTNKTILYANFTSVATFRMLDFSGLTTGNSTYYLIELYRNSTGWTSVYMFTYPGSYRMQMALNGTGYIDANGTVQARVISDGAGNVSERLQVDWLVLEGSQAYSMYCSSGFDTQLVFIFHEMETQMMIVILNIMPYIAMMIAVIIAIQFVMLLVRYWGDKKGEKR